MDPKQRAAAHAVGWVRSGMVVGLGSGSTALHAVRHLGEALREGRLRDVTGVSTSQRTTEVARELGIRLLGPDDFPVLDLAIDGADEVAPNLDLIKGLGGALLYEKIVAARARQLIIVVDASKLSARLGERAPVPVEVVTFAWRTHLAWLRAHGAQPTLRLGDGGRPFVTDGGHYIVDCRFGPLHDPTALARVLSERPGVVEHGLFLGLASRVVVGYPDRVEVIEAAREA